MRGPRAETINCAKALEQISDEASAPLSQSALAHALGECALLDGDLQEAVLQFSQAVDSLQTVPKPLEYAQSQLRLGVALAAAGNEEAAIEHLLDACQTALQLKVRPLDSLATSELSNLGWSVRRRRKPIAR